MNKKILFLKASVNNSAWFIKQKISIEWILSDWILQNLYNETLNIRPNYETGMIFPLHKWYPLPNSPNHLYNILIIPFLIFSRTSSTDKAWEGVESDSLFVCDAHADDVIQRMIEHAQSVAFWVAAEIVSCSSQKVNFHYMHMYKNILA